MASLNEHTFRSIAQYHGGECKICHFHCDCSYIRPDSLKKLFIDSVNLWPTLKQNRRVELRPGLRQGDSSLSIDRWCAKSKRSASCA